MLGVPLWSRMAIAAGAKRRCNSLVPRECDAALPSRKPLRLFEACDDDLRCGRLDKIDAMGSILNDRPTRRQPSREAKSVLDKYDVCIRQVSQTNQDHPTLRRRRLEPCPQHERRWPRQRR